METAVVLLRCPHLLNGKNCNLCTNLTAEGDVELIIK